MKEVSNFQYIWQEWVEPLIVDLYQQLDENFVSCCNVHVRRGSEVCIKAEKYYQKKREEVKQAFYGEYHKGDSVNEHRMDFHKIGAVLCRTLIEYKIFEFDMKACKKYVDENVGSYDTNWVVRNALVNFRLAFYVSVVFLYYAMDFKYSAEDTELCQRLRENKRLDLYSGQFNIGKNQVQESFENCIVLDLAKRDINNRSFDYFMYAIILYQLEEHNKNLLLTQSGACPL